MRSSPVQSTNNPAPRGPHLQSHRVAREASPRPCGSQPLSSAGRRGPQASCGDITCCHGLGFLPFEMGWQRGNKQARYGLGMVPSVLPWVPCHLWIFGYVYPVSMPLHGLELASANLPPPHHSSGSPSNWVILWPLNPYAQTQSLLPHTTNIY
jgi:hypothetical protein